ncbi:MAG: FtsW/RodA/SpoVE family cell cycle protein [Candidatus Kryptoniota bacterium]
MKETVHHRPADRFILFIVLMMMASSLFIVYSASAFWAELKFNNPAYLFQTHLFKVLLATVILFIILRIDYHIYSRYLNLFLGGSLILLISVLAQRVIVKGAARWIHLGFLSFEPSDFARISIILFIAVYLTENREKLNDYHSLIKPLIITGIAALLIVVQPNFSTAIMLLFVVGIMLFAGGVRLRHLALLGTAIILIGSLVLVIESYRVNRIQSWLSNGSNNYQARQSIIGFGNGSWFGVGPGNSRQRNLFLPESYGDFIYSIIGEEYGFVGSVAVLMAFLLFAWRGTAIAKKAPDRLGYTLAVGITSSICIYGLANAAVAIGLLPTTGLPMPFISYGGTALLINAFAAGILLNISKQIPETKVGISTETTASADKNLPPLLNPVKVTGRSGQVVGRIYK